MSGSKDHLPLILMHGSETNSAMSLLFPKPTMSMPSTLLEKQDYQRQAGKATQVMHMLY
ncbi:hypothetical protein [Cohnella sp. WQ 127256]|uniref:hypothetical protein n=1 Tax=Cohnella sp. WQ 127256 TaxID=2938790 RepID=UPI00211778D2|nr:hypothetical protein [Cohnella sp. WQ 127256]